MAKAPAARGFTVSEKRGIRFEQVSLYMVFLVAVIAATLSFVALTAVGRDAGLGRFSFMLPLTLDGIGIACSVGIVRSVAEGENLRSRLSEWVGLLASLALSIRGNVEHALDVGAASLPDDIKITYAVAIPLIVAYGIHVYGRAMSKGISAHVLADNPDELRFDLQHLGDTTQTLARARAPRVAPVARKEPARAPKIPEGYTPATAQPRATRTNDTREAAYQAYAAARDNGRELDGNELGELLNCHPGNARNTRNKNFRPRYDAERGVADPIVAQVDAERRSATQDRASA